MSGKNEVYDTRGWGTDETVTRVCRHCQKKYEEPVMLRTEHAICKPCYLRWCANNNYDIDKMLLARAKQLGRIS